MKRLNKPAGYRAMLGYTQEKMAEKIGINSKQLYSMKERGIISFNDNEKRLFKNIVSEFEPNITIDDIFF